MEVITKHSLIRATDEAVRLWAFASAQYPKRHQIILNTSAASIIEAASSFALNARRALEVLPRHVKFHLIQSRWKWVPTSQGELVRDLWDALNRIIHARTLSIGYEQLPAELSIIDGGALIVPYIQAETDRKKLAFIDLFALAHAYLYQAYPMFTDDEIENNAVH